MYLVQIEDFATWREVARELLKRCIEPERVGWQPKEQQGLAFGGDADFRSLPVKQPVLNIPRNFFGLAQHVACFRDQSRWSLLYSLAWRLLFEDKKLLDNKLDPQVSRLNGMHRAVARDIHKMEAFVRFKHFQPQPGQAAAAQPEHSPEYFVAWFEPQHLIVPTASAFFVKRFYTMCWSILTPDICAHWDCENLRFTPGLADAPRLEDELETLWLQYYASIFNPARLKLKAMQAEMPKKYWHNLPETRLIPELTRSANRRMQGMIDSAETPAWQKTAKSRFVKQKQQRLREKRQRGQDALES